MRIKRGVSLLGLQPQMVIAAIIVEQVSNDYGQECWITSNGDGVHSSPRSRHYIGFAVDFRNRDVPQRKKQAMADEIQKRLNSEFYVKLESTHIHVQFNGSSRV